MGRRKSLRSLVFGFVAAVLSATLFSSLMPQAAKASNDVPWLDSALVLSRASNGPFVSVSNSSLLPNNPVNSDFTVEVWAQRTGSFAANTKYYLWGIDSKGLYVYNNTFYWKHDDSTNTSTGVSVPNYGEWFHAAIVCVNSTKTIKLVLNGTSTSWSKSFTTLIYNGSSAIGASSPNTPYDAWDGLIDQFKVYNSALSDAQIAQSMNTYSNVGITGSPTLSHHISFNDKKPNTQYTDFGLYNMGIGPTGSTFVYQDVKTIDTTSRPGKTIYGFPRTYLTPQGGWQAPVSMNDNFEYLAVGGGGGGGGNRGGGGGAGGLLTGTVKIATGAAYKIVVGAGGYSAANGGATTIQSLNGTSASLNALGGGAGGTHTGTANGATGGSGGGTSLCGLSLSPTGGAGTAGQGYAGASSDTSICGDRATSSDPYPRSTGGGGGSSASGVLGKGTTSTPTANTSGDIRPDGGAGTSNSISGTATVYAAGGGGAIALGIGEDIAGGAYSSSYFGLGGSSIGGDGALVGATGNHAAAGRGSGGGGGGATAENALTSGGFGSAGVVYLVATPGITLSTAAAGAELNTTLIQQPTFTTTGAISLTDCSATDLLGSSSGVSVTCTAISGTNSISLTDLKFTSGTAGTYYLVTYSFSNGETVSQEIPLLYIPASIVVATATPSSNVIWDRGVPMATAASAAIQIVNTTTNTQFTSYPVSLVATGAVTQNSSATITGTTAGFPLLIKGLTISSSANITIANAPVTLWATNANSATGTTGATGVSLGNNVTITTAGGAITIGGGANPASSPVTAEKAISFGTSANLNAGGGDISIRGDAVYNSNLSATTDNEMWGVKLAKTTVQTVGSGTISIVGNGQGATNGRLGFGVGFFGSGSNVTAVDGNISVNGGNLGSANVNAIYADSSGAIRTTGTGSINITGDGRGTTTTATALASSTTKNYGVGFTGTLFDVTTVDGSIAITGYAGSHAAGTIGSNPVGVWLESSTVKSTGIGTVSVSGFGGDVGSPTTAIAQTSTGVYSSSLLNTTTGAVSISGLSGSIANSQGADPLEIGLHFKKGSTAVAGLGSLQTTSGSITVTGDTSRPDASAIRVIERGIYVETGLFINSTSGNIQVTGTACSTCSPGTDPAAKGYGIDWTAGTNPTWSYISTSGAGTINMVGRADNMKTTTTASGLSYGISFVSNGTARNTISSDSGAVSITGSVTAPGGSGATGVDFISAKINTNSGAISVTGTGSSTTSLAYGVNFTTANFTSQTGAVNLTGLANTTTAGGYGFRGNVVTVSTLSSPISISGEHAATTASGGATYYGTYLTDSSATSGNSSTPTTGGQISIVGKSPDFTIGTIYGIRIDNTSSVDTYNGDIVLTSNTAAAQTVSNPSRTGMWFAGTLTLAASAANLTINNYAGAIGSRQIWLVGAMNFTIGSATSHVNVVVNSNAFSRDENGQSVNFKVDTDGTYSLIPYANSFFADVYSITSTNGVMQTLFAPTERVSAITLGKSGNTRAITLNKPIPLSTTSGHLKVYGGNIVSTQAISANTLALDSSGTVQLSNVANDFRNVAVRRANATGFNLVNAATSWTAGTYDSIVGVYGVPSTLKASGTPPSTVQLGNTLATYSVIAADGYGDLISAANTRSTDALSVTTSVQSGATTTLGGTTTQTGTTGAALGFNDLTFSNPGVHTLAFDATGYTQYVSPNVTVSGGTPTLSLSYFSGTDTTNFATATTTANPTFSSNNTNNAVYSSLTTSVCTVVAGTGVITTKTPGTCTIKVDQTADSVYLAGTLTINVTINKTPQGALTITSTSGSYGAVLALATSGASVGALTYVVDSGTCTLASSTTLSLGAVGSTCMVTATRAGDATYAAVSSVSTSITTNKGTQALLVTPSGLTISYLSAGLDLSTLTFSGGSGTGTIGFSTSTTGCSINGTVLTSTNHVGGTACSISAVKAGDDSYNTGSPSVFTVAISKANQAALTVTSTSATYGQSLALTYSGGSGAGAITFSLVSGSCTVSGTTLTPTAASTCVIKVTKELDTDYNVASSADTTVNIAKGTQAALSISSTSGSFGTALSLTTSGGTDNGAVTYVVDSGTCSLATASTLNLGAVGDTCMVTATKAATSNYEAISSSSTSIATVRANQAALVAPTGVSLTFGDSNGLDLTALTFTGGNGTGSISFSTATVGCAIASNVLTSTNNAATTCVVESTKAGDSSYNTGTAVNLTVTIAKANQAPLVISTTVGTYGTALTLTTTGGTDNGAVTFAKDSGTCSLASGVLTLGNAATTCFVTATKAATTNYNAVSSTSTSIITNKASQATLVITSTSGTYNSALTLTTSGGTDSGAVTYAVDSGTCVVNGSTLTLGNAGDSCFVTATKATTTNYLVAVSVSTSISTGRAAQAALIVPTTTNLSYGDTNGINLAGLTITGGSGTGLISFASSTSGCTVTAITLTSTNNAGTTCTVIATKAGDANYNASTGANLTVTIVKANQAALVAPVGVTLTYANSAGLDLTSLTFTGGSGTGSLSFSTATTGCSITNNILTSTNNAATACNVATVKATDTNFNVGSSANLQVSITRANQAPVVITTTTGTYGETLSLSATGGNDSGGISFTVDSGTCSISGVVLTLGNAGSSCMVTASKAASNNYNVAYSASTSITTNKAQQTSLIITSTSGTFGQTLSLTTSGGNDNGAVTYVVDSGSCSVASSILTLGNAGSSCMVTATKAQTSNYHAVSSISTSIATVKANQSSLVAPTGIELPYADANGLNLNSLTFTGGSGTGNLSFSTSTVGCSISGNILTSTLNAQSSCTVATSKAADTNFNASSTANFTVAIVRATQAPLIINSTIGTYGFLLSLTTTGGNDTGPVTFTVDSGTCTISGSGLTLGDAGSSCMVTAGKSATNNYEPIFSASTSITSLRASQTPLVIVSTSGTYGQPLSLVTSGGSDNGALTFAVDSGTCSVNGSTLTLGDAGSSCMVTATKAQTTNYNVKSSVSTSITTAKANQTALTVTSLATTYGATMALTTSGGTSGGAVTFHKFSGTCTISGAVLTPTGAGNCVIFATMSGGTNYNNVTSANATVVIAKANQAPLVLNMANSVPYLASLALTTSGGSGTGNVVFSVTQNSVCSITGTNLTPLDVGSTCEVLATKLGDANYNSVDATSVQITTTPINQLPITFNSANVMTYGQTLSLSAIGGSGNGAISYSVNDAGSTGCSLSGATLSVTASGTCVVSAVKAAALNYNVGAQVNQTVTVNKAAQTVTFTSVVPGSPIVGASYTVSATSTSATVPTFTIASGNCTISSSVVTFTGTGSCRIDANAGATNQYLAAPTAWQTIAVGQRNQTLTFDAATLALTTKTFGDPAFVAVATSSVSGLNPVFSRGAATTNNACLVSTSGVVTVVAVGVCQIQADQAGDTNTAAATAETLNFNVVADVANAPTIVSVSAGHESITAAFVKPSYTGGAPVTGYEMVAIHSGGQETFNGCTVVAGNDQSCTISGLTNGTSYTIKVAAINSAGVGLQSASSLARVPATNPAAVTRFTAVPDNTTLQLSWGLPVSLGGGTFDSYRIFIKPSTDANYPLTYTTVNVYNTLGYQFTNLVNGQAYDAMIVTVTTANTLALVSNTAEVRETPRTVPDAPATVLFFEVGSNLVISWTSPLADGGNAISEYSAQIGGAPCVLATPTDTTCTITTPSAAGTYPIEVKAKNAAGFGQAITTTFTKAAVIVPAPPVVIPPSGGGNENVTNPRIRMLVLDISSGFASTLGGSVLTFKTLNMEKITEVLVSGAKAKILLANKSMVRVQMPKHALGPVTIRFIGPNGSLDLVDAVTYVKGRPAASKVTIKNFIQENSTLSVAAKKSLRQALTSNPTVTSVTCVGYQSWSYDRPLDAQTAIQRAKTACAYLKSIKKSLTVKSVIARTTLVGVQSRKLEVIFK